MLAAFDFAKYSNAAHALEPIAVHRRDTRSDRCLGEILWEGLFVESLATDVRAHAVSEVADRIIVSVGQWAVSQDDDLTVLVCDYVGTEE